MKKYFKIAAIAVLAMGLTVACKSKQAEEVVDTIDSTIDMVVEDTTDSVEMVAEEPEVEPAKPVAKKENKTGKVQAADANTMTPGSVDPKANREAKAVATADVQESTTKNTPAPGKADPKANRR
jgi:hypothetical protein